MFKLGCLSFHGMTSVKYLLANTWSKDEVPNWSLNHLFCRRMAMWLNPHCCSVPGVVLILKPLYVSQASHGSLVNCHGGRKKQQVSTYSQRNQRVFIDVGFWCLCMFCLDGTFLCLSFYVFFVALFHQSWRYVGSIETQGNLMNWSIL